MADSVRIIVHSGKHGLEVAADYYTDFPREPSPAGELNLDKAIIVKLKDATLDTVLEEMTKAGSGSTVLLVCHAWEEGLFMPLATGSRLSAGKSAIVRLLEVSAAERKAKRIRAMPSATDAEKKAKIAAWSKLTDELAAGAIVGEVSLQEVERLYENWVEEVAKNELFLPSPSRTNMARLVTNMEKVQALRLDRVELRACSIGAYATSMSKLKQLFGCNQLLAPTVSTFYLKGMPVTTLNIFDRRYIAEHRVGNFRPPGPLGKTVKDPTDYVMDVVKKNPGTRLFWDYQFGYIPPENPHPAPNRYDGGTTTIKMRRVFAMLVEELKPYYFRGSGATWNETPKHNAEWDDAKKFVNDYIMQNARYKQGSLTVSGFWTPGEREPWLLPNDPEYIEHIQMAK